VQGREEAGRCGNGSMGPGEVHGMGCHGPRHPRAVSHSSDDGKRWFRDFSVGGAKSAK